MVTFSKLNNRQHSVWTWVWILHNILPFCVWLIKCKKSLFPEFTILFLFWRSYSSWGITSNYSDLDTGRLKCCGLNRALLFTVPSARDVVTYLFRLEIEERIKCVFYVFLKIFVKFSKVLTKQLFVAIYNFCNFSHLPYWCCVSPPWKCYFCYAILLFFSLYFTGLDSSFLLQPSHTLFFARLKDVVVTDVDSRTLHKKVLNYKILSFTWFLVSCVCIKVKCNTYSYSTLLKTVGLSWIPLFKYDTW